VKRYCCCKANSP